MTELQIKITNKLIDFGIVPDKSNIKHIDDIIEIVKKEQLTIPVVVGQSEQFTCDAENNQQVKCKEQCFGAKQITSTKQASKLPITGRSYE